MIEPSNAWAMVTFLLKTTTTTTIFDYLWSGSLNVEKRYTFQLIIHSASLSSELDRNTLTVVIISISLWPSSAVELQWNYLTKKMLEPPVFYIPLYWLVFYHFPFLSQSTFLLLASQGRLYKVRNNTTTLLQTFLILKFRNTHTILWMPFSTSKCDVHSTQCW